MMQAFGNILDSPLESVTGLISGMGQLMSSAFQLIGGLIKTILDVFSSIMSIFIGGDDEDGGGKSNPLAKIAEIVTTIVSAIDRKSVV